MTEISGSGYNKIMQTQNPLIAALQNPALYPHDVTGFEVIETHLSWVILTGPYAYKIKKPLNLGFQDYTTLEKRQHYCELEIQYNQPLAGALYIEVCPILGTPTEPRFSGKGAPQEYAVRMRQFDQSTLWSVLADKGQLSTDTMEPLAQQLGLYHRHQPADRVNAYGSPLSIIEPIKSNFEIIQKNLPPDFEPTLLAEQLDWVLSTYESHYGELLARKNQGAIKACHGDLHLGNMAFYDKKPLVFDCIEFNEDFRWIDTVSDVGFLTMDLACRQLWTHRALFLNTYLETNFDYQGMGLLAFYQHYRAMVRAKIAILTAAQQNPKSPEHTKQIKAFQRYFALAQEIATPKKPALSITMGPSGSGKSLYTEHQMVRNQAIRLRSDVFRKHLFATATSPDVLYHESSTQHVYQALKDTAAMLLKAHFSVIIDATCLKQWQRDLFFNCAQDLQVDFKIWAFEAHETALIENIQHREARGDLISDASIPVMKAQIEAQEPLNETEEQHAERITQAIIKRMMQDKQ